MIRATSDSQFTCTARRTVRALEDAGAPVYRGLYDHARAGAIGTLAGASHGSELIFQFGGLERSGNTFRAIDADVSALLVDEWAALARDGAPSAAWPRVTSDPAQTFVIASPTSVQAGVAEAECDVWDRVTALGL